MKKTQNGHAVDGSWAAVGQFSGSCHAVVRQLLGSCQAVIRQFSGSCQAVVRQLSGNRCVRRLSETILV